MATFPVTIYAAGQPLSPDGEHKTLSSTALTTASCVRIDDVWMLWSAFSYEAGSVSGLSATMAPSVPPYAVGSVFGDPALNYEAVATLPDGPSIGLAYFANRNGYAWEAHPIGGPSWAQIKISRSGLTFTFTVRVASTRYSNGANGHVDNPCTVTASFGGPPTSVTLTNDGAYLNWTEAVFVYTLRGGEAAITFNATDALGMYASPLRVYARPHAAFVVDETNTPILIADASSSLAFASTLTYTWTAPGASPAPGNVVSPTLDYSVYAEGLGADTSRTISLLVTTDHGCTDTTSLSVTIPPVGRNATLIDEIGVQFSAVREGNNIRVNRVTGGVATVEQRALLAGHNHPSIMAHHGTIHVAGLQASDGTTKLYRSTDGGRTLT